MESFYYVNENDFGHIPKQITQYIQCDFLLVTILFRQQVFAKYG